MINQKKYFFSVLTPFKDRVELAESYFKYLSVQKFKNFEIVIAIDSGSITPFNVSENAIKLAHNKFFEEDNLKIIRVPDDRSNSSPGRARNFGMLNADGEWLAFLDIDDIFYQEKLGDIFEFIKKNREIEFISHDFRNVNTIQNINSNVVFDNADYCFENLLFLKIHILPSASFLKISALKKIGDFDLSYIRGQDWDFFLRIYANKEVKSLHLNRVLTDRILDGKNISDRDFSENLKNKRDIFLKNLKQLNNKTYFFGKILYRIMSFNIRIYMYSFLIEPLQKFNKRQ